MKSPLSIELLRYDRYGEGFLNPPTDLKTSFTQKDL